MSRQAFCLILAFMWNFPGAVNAAPAKIDDALKAIEKQDYKAASRLFMEMAEKGDAEAQYNLAIMYRQGKGVKQDTKLALKWFEKSAAQGLASAEYYLGHLYDSGDGVPRDPVIAVGWYKKAAEKGNPLAQSNLGVAYASGEGVKQDIIKAYVWFSLAASQGLTAALENRNILKKEMSEELQTNAQRLMREYFNKYVAPFRPQANKLTRSGHPGVSNAHQRMDSPTSQRPIQSQQAHPPIDHGDHQH